MLPLLLSSCGIFPVGGPATGRSNNRFVDPFIGTGAHGHTYPGATVPFGMVQLSPDNGISGWDWSSGYHRPDSILVGFSHTHLSGTGIGDLLDVLFQPVTGEVDPVRQQAGREAGQVHAWFRQAEERAEPGYYSVPLRGAGGAGDAAARSPGEPERVLAELTATPRVGWHRYTFPAGAGAGLFIDLGFAVNWDAPTASGMEVRGDSLVTGYRHSKGWAPDQRLWFAAKFSRPITGWSLAQDSSASAGGVRASGVRVRGLLRFAPAAEPLVVKVAISYVDAEGALRNLDAEAGGWDFEGTRAAARAAWAEALGSIRIETKDVARARTFYTALYHTQLAPVLFEDVDHRYRGGDGRVHTAGFRNYSIFSLWDTFRAAHPLFTIIDPERVDDLVRSMLAFQREHGLLPVWSLVGNETNTMTGYHAIPVIADAWLKGFRGFDGNEALDAMIRSAQQDERGLAPYRQYGFIPSEADVESVTKTLEYAYDDWAIARMAESLGRADDARRFRARAGSWRNVFDPATRFMRGRHADSTWVTPFDPKFASDREHRDYTEGNAWQHTWFVPHDVAGLIERMGGDGAFIAKLDSLFQADTALVGQHASVDISGMIGQYAHGNEPSHHIAYLYSYAGAPGRTAEQVRQILTTLYDDSSAGLSGNEDCGQMSAWYVLSALGFYPVDPVGGVYVLGTPLFERAEIAVGPRRSFRIFAPGVSDEAKYIRGAMLNGRPLQRSWISHEEIVAGGTLMLLMGKTPSPTWGVSPEDRPPSAAGGARE
ncbi:MAG: glycoside hydrolase family 92 protein [Gemmatimonadetes bacterium]|nr:glycoside hydrolase family 92 protein [Gemmatimonadota bacterium]